MFSPALRLCVKIFLAILSLFCLTCSFAAVITVPGNYATIQAAIDASSDGDEIIVSPGIYYENIYFDGKNIILRSTDPTSPTIVGNTTIDARYFGSVVTFSGTEASSCVLSGFTIKKGYAPNGGGIYGNGTHATISQNGIVSNGAYGGTADGCGAGLYRCDGRIRQNIIRYNRATGTHASGGGLYGCDGDVLNNMIMHNYAEYVGGGLSDCDGQIQNNMICNNSSPYLGGGLSYCDGTIQGNTIYGNSGMYGSALYSCYAFLIHCIIWANPAPYYNPPIDGSSNPMFCCIEGWDKGGRGNILFDPQFEHAAGEDFHLKSSSPCIDAGDENYLFGEYIADIDGECRVSGGALDIGADEHGSLPDSDGDLLSDASEGIHGSDPMNADTDGDGLQDGMEVRRGTSPTHADAPTSISIPSQLRSIQVAIFRAFPSEEIIVSPGIQNENLHFLGKNLVLRSVDPYDENTVNSCIIDGGRFNSVITFCGTEDGTCAVKGFTIRQGDNVCGGGLSCHGAKVALEYNKITSNWAGYGGGVCECDGNVENNTVAGNYADGTGGGLYGCDGTIENNAISSNQCGSYGKGGGLAACDGIIENNVISSNSADSGCGLYDCQAVIQNNVISRNSAPWGSYGSGGGLEECDSLIQNNIISGNSAAGGGGGLAGCDGLVQANQIANNEANEGGGLAYCRGTFRNNIICGNTAQSFGGGMMNVLAKLENNTIYGNSAWYGGGVCQGRGPITNCIIWQNTASGQGSQLYDCPTPSYSCVQTWTGGTGNIYSDPQFVNAGTRDFHLRATSPCIDAGGSVAGLTQDFEGDPRPYDAVTWQTRGDGSDFDIGADEFIGTVPSPTPSPSPTPWVIVFDFDHDTDHWTTAGAETVFVAPDFTFEPGHLKIISRNNTNTFGYWQSSSRAIPRVDGYLYRATFTVSTNLTGRALVPQIRLRANSNNLQQADSLTITSAGDGGASPTPLGTVYDLYFVPASNANYSMLAFDLLNFDGADAPEAELALEEVVVEIFRLGWLGSPIMTWSYDFDTGDGFWSTGDGGGVFTDPEFFWEAGALQLRSTTNTNTFGYWHSSDLDIITSTTPLLYRGTFDVRTDVTDRSRVPQMRLRFNTGNLQASRTLSIESVGDGANSPGTINTTYDRLYFLPPANCLGGGLIVSFDMLNFSPDDALTGSLMLDRAVIEALPPSFSP